MPSIPNIDSIKGIDCQSGVQALISVVPSNRIRGNGQKLGQFRTNTRKSFFTVRVREHWNRLPSGAEESPSMGTLKNQLGTFLCDLL